MKAKRTMLLVSNLLFTFMLAISVLTVPGAKAACNNCWEIVASPNVGEATRLHAAAALAANMVVAVGGYTDTPEHVVDRPLIERWNGTSWSIITSPSNEPMSELYAVSRVPVLEADSPNLWTVGYRGATSQVENETLYPELAGAKTLVMRSSDSGVTWSTVSSPNPGSDSNVLTSVAGTSSSDVWVVGYSRDTNGSYQSLAMHWNGTGWTQTSTPNPGQNNYLTSIYAIPDTSPTRYWAVGYYQGGAPEQNMILQWNGTQWVLFDSPQPGIFNPLLGVTAVSEDEAWAVGEYVDPNVSNVGQALTLHWLNGQWFSVPAQNPGNVRNRLYGVAPIASNFVWAVGLSDNSGPNEPLRTLTERWDGSQWVQVTSPNQGYRVNELRGVTVVPGTSVATGGDVWAVGYHTEHGVERTLIMRYYIPAPVGGP